MTTVLKGISLSVLGVLFSFAVTAESAHAGRNKDPMEKGGEKQCMMNNCSHLPKGPQKKQCKKQCKRMIGPGGRPSGQGQGYGGGYGAPGYGGQGQMYGRPY